MRIGRRLVCGIVAFTVVRSALGLTTYSVVSLGREDGGVGSQALGINNRGDVVGDTYVGTTNNYHAFLYSNGVMHDLGTLGGALSRATGINDSGVIVGFSNTAAGGIDAFEYSNGVMHDLGVSGAAYGINQGGQITGYYYPTDTSDADAFLYSNGVLTPLTPPWAFHPWSTVGMAINSAGVVVGANIDGNFANSAGEWTAIPGLPSAINGNGDIVGEISDASGLHAFLETNGIVSNIETLPGSSSDALGINSSDQVVGEVELSNGRRAFLYSNGEMIDLNTLIDPAAHWSLSEATAINDAGQIVGVGEGPDGYDDAFLLTPIAAPEPGTVLVLGVGGVMVLRRRRGECVDH